MADEKNGMINYSRDSYYYYRTHVLGRTCRHSSPKIPNCYIPTADECHVRKIPKNLAGARPRGMTGAFSG